MRLRLCVFSFAAMSGAYFPTLAAGQVIAAGPTYVCNGDRLHLESCDIRTFRTVLSAWWRTSTRCGPTASRPINKLRKADP